MPIEIPPVTDFHKTAISEWRAARAFHEESQVAQYRFGLLIGVGDNTPVLASLPEIAEEKSYCQ